MTTLIITDIPRIAALAERTATERDDLVVVGEIYRGIEELERFKPELIIIQNYLSGLSADIIHKHLKSRLQRAQTRFALISPSEGLDAKLSSQFLAILDPALPDDQFAQQLAALLDRPEQPPTQPAGCGTGQPPVFGTALPTPATPGPYDEPPPATMVDQVHLSPSVPPPAMPAPPDAERDGEPLTYGPHRRQGSTVISSFSRQLDSSAEELHLRPASLSDPSEEPPISELHQALPAQQDTPDGTPPHPWRTGLWALSGMVVLVVIITLLQQRTPTPHGITVQTAPKPTVPPVVAPTRIPAATGQQPPPRGRLTTLPSFIPQAGINPGYAKDNPGWESYSGQANEYRVFRGKGHAIKALQVIDRSGAGIQDAFYASVLKELSGTSAIQTTSSTIKEGYEIRRGTIAGLRLVQYRDARGGRLRGFVVTWP